jgi:hypothetical protein
MHRLGAATLAVLVLLCTTFTSAACRSTPQMTAADRLARGRTIVERMSRTLAAASAFTVTTRETRDIARRDGRVEPHTVTRQVTLRRPDRLYFTTSGDNEAEGWYDGKRLTIVAHREKVYAQAPMPETLDRTLDALQERYGMPLPGADFLYSNPAHALLADTTTGGWVGEEMIDGRRCDHVAFSDKGVKWDAWIATDAALPARATAEFPNTRKVRKLEMGFSGWNLQPSIADARFAAAVPADYEGIAIIQRAAALKNRPADAPTGGREKE